MAALTVPVTGNGATISGLGITTLITSISAAKVKVTPLNISVLATTGFHKTRPGDLRDPVQVTVEFYWTGAAPPITTTMVPTSEPYAGTTFTITYPGAGSLAGTAFVTDADFPSPKNGEVMKGSFTIQYDGATGPAFTAA
jgi:hypothetical protein